MLKTVGNPSTRYGDQTITDGNLVIGTAGKGIDFSASSHGSGMTSELLADYEEGIHVATITPGTSGTVTLDSSSDTLSYTKVGRVVTVTGYLSVSTLSVALGYFSISLPFAISSLSENSSRSAPSVTLDAALSKNLADFVGIGIQGQSSVRIYLGDAASLQANSAQQLISGGGIHLCFTYNAA